MNKKLVKRIVALFEKYRALKFCFLLLTLYLLVEEFLAYLILKPTLTSRSQGSLKPSHFPNILICPRPSFDLGELQSLGYEHSHDYTMGVSPFYHSDGWIGNQPAVSAEEVSQRISIIKTVEDCPETIGQFYVGEKIEEVVLEMALTRPMYPNGKCCQVVKPAIAGVSVPRLIFYRTFQLNYTRREVKQFRVFLSDQGSSSHFRPYKFNIDGDKIFSKRTKPGYAEYKLKISEENHLAEDPNYPCRPYQAREYDSCLERHFLEETLGMINCSPPWLTDRREMWCRGHLNLSEAQSNSLTALLGRTPI